MSIFDNKVVYFSKINISLNCKGKDLKFVPLNYRLATTLFILSFYRVPTGYFNQSIKNVVDTLKLLYKPKAEFVET